MQFVSYADDDNCKFQGPSPQSCKGQPLFRFSGSQQGHHSGGWCCAGRSRAKRIPYRASVGPWAACFFLARWPHHRSPGRDQGALKFWLGGEWSDRELQRTYFQSTTGPVELPAISINAAEALENKR